MKVTLNKLNTSHTMPKTRVHSAPVTFCGVDEFVKNPVSQTYWETRKALQREYLPGIANLRNEQRTLWQGVCDSAVAEQVKDKRAVYKLNELLEKIDHLRGIEKGSRTPIAKLVAMLDEMSLEGHFIFGMDRHRPINCVMATSKDKQLAEDFLNFTEFWSKVTNPSTSKNCASINNPYTNIYQLDFKRIKDVSDNNTLQEALFDALKKSEEHFQKTGRKTIINVENMGRLLNPELNEKSGIAIMKNLMNIADKDFHALVTFAATDPSKFDPGTTVSHRIKFKFNLDDAGITQSDLDLLKRYQSHLQPTIDGIDAIYQEGGPKSHKLLQEIERLKKEFKQKLAELDKRFPTKESRGPRPVLEPPKPIIPDVTPIKPPLKDTVKKLSKTRIGLIAAGIISVLAFAGVVLYKKSKKTGSKLPTELENQATQAPQNNISTQVSNPLSQTVSMQDFLKKSSLGQVVSLPK